VDELTALYTMTRYFKEKPISSLAVVATDVGDAKRARNVADHLGAPLAIVEKRRIGNEQRAEAVNIIGDVGGMNTLIVDDEVDTGSTLVVTVDKLLQHGAVDVYACCTHPVLSGEAVQRIEESPIKELVVTDTIPLPPVKRLPKITVLSLASLLGEAIRRIHTGHSVGELFQ
jgi:ribose-phosphate pyrophosphokinase